MVKMFHKNNVEADELNVGINDREHKIYIEMESNDSIDKFYMYLSVEDVDALIDLLTRSIEAVNEYYN